jgi:GT2 family glycosyltransferase
MSENVLLSVLIKTLNEEHKLSRCLGAVFNAIQEWGGKAEVIVADSRSADGTVAIAKNFPVKVVVLAPAEPRGCGVGVQLGYQHAQGQFVLLLDGDMQLQPGFLATALAALEADPSLAGVAGILVDTAERNRFDRHRAKTKPSARTGPQAWLNGGGLYRAAAIKSAGGYAGNQNLLAYEEAELGLRLGAKGWKLVRLPTPYVLHTGHALGTWALIRRMWNSGRMAASGVLLKCALGQPWIWRVIRMQMHPLTVTFAWLAFAVALVAGWPTWPIGLLLLAAVGMAMLAIRKGSIVDAAFSILLWHLSALGLWKGMLAGIVAPTRRIGSEEIDSSDVRDSTLRPS